ncbi:MAG: hypothetical protein R3A11_04945 [Bdellovibrionota bacterium]
MKHVRAPHSRKFLHVAILLNMMMLGACSTIGINNLDPADFEGLGGGSGPGGVSCTGVDTTFSTSILPIFSDRGCLSNGCHAGSGITQINLDPADNNSGEGTSGVWGQLLDKSEPERVDLDSPATSTILTKPLGVSHAGNDIFTGTGDADYRKIACWINDGALLDSTNSTCSFGGHVYPIFKAQGCTGCHGNSGGLTLSGASPAAYTELNGVSGTKIKNILTGVVSHSGGTVFATTNENYQTIECWVNEGKLNN